jgi:surface antigen
VFASSDRPVGRSVYNGRTAPRLCRLPARAAAVVAVLAALTAGGCSSYRLDSMFAKQEPDAELTGSVGAAGSPVRRADVPPSEADLVYARAAAAAALTRGGKDNNVPWQNPQTGAGGNIIPLASASSEGGAACRDFLASYVRAGSQTWLQGAACRTSHGEWEVKSLKPLSG